MTSSRLHQDQFKVAYCVTTLHMLHGVGQITVLCEDNSQQATGNSLLASEEQY